MADTQHSAPFSGPVTGPVTGPGAGSVTGPVTGSFTAPFTVLLVEDNPGDVGLIRRALQQATIATRLDVRHDGAEAVDYLLGSVAGGSAPRPDLILLDLSLPCCDGCEVLTQLKRHTLLCSIPVVILSSSQAEQDILRTYQQQANCYITKPIDLEQYMTVMQAVQRYYYAVSQLPRSTHHA